MGSEEDGISPEYLKLCDASVKIPMPGETQSLNVSAAGPLCCLKPFANGWRSRKGISDKMEVNRVRGSKTEPCETIIYTFVGTTNTIPMKKD